MLGDNVLLVGSHQYKIDAKGRMFLPASTGREVGENIYLVYDSVLEKHAIYSQKELDKIMKKFDEQILEAKTAEELKFSKERLLSFAMNASGPFIVDSQGRIFLGKNIDYEGPVNIIGAYNHLILDIPVKKK